MVQSNVCVIQKSLEEDDDDDSSSEESENVESLKENLHKQMKLQRALKKIDTFYNLALVNLAIEGDFCFVGRTDNDQKNPD